MVCNQITCNVGIVNTEESVRAGETEIERGEGGRGVYLNAQGQTVNQGFSKCCRKTTGIVTPQGPSEMQHL